MSVTLKHGTHWLLPPPKARKMWWAFTNCPKCAKGGALRKGQHTVARDGVVTPSYVCPHCDFHEWVRLEGWDPEVTQ